MTHKDSSHFISMKEQAAVNIATGVTHCILIVVYKRPLSQLALLNALRHSVHRSKFKITIWDNSPHSQEDDVFLKELAGSGLEVCYHSTPENLALSKIYNRFIDACLISSHSMLLHFFDQDTVVTDKYFDEIILASSRHAEIDLFLPQVLHEQLTVSPVYKRYGFLPRPITHAGIHPSKSILFVNSGSCFRNRFFNDSKFRFDERLHFYGTDTQIALHHARRKPALYCLQTRIDHNLFFQERRDAKELHARTREVIRSIRLIYAHQESSTMTKLRILLFLARVLRTNGVKSMWHFFKTSRS